MTGFAFLLIHFDCYRDKIWHTICAHITSDLSFADYPGISKWKYREY